MAHYLLAVAQMAGIDIGDAQIERALRWCVQMFGQKLVDILQVGHKCLRFGGVGWFIGQQMRVFL